MRSPRIPVRFRAVDITTGDIESYRHHRREQGVSPVTSNHDLKLLRKMFAWGVRERLIPATPFKVGESVVALDPETPRERRFASDDDETRLLRAANPHLRGILVAMLDTCCRPGEILSLQWGDVHMASRELVVRAEKAKTRRPRGVRLADLRHEAASRLEEVGVPATCHDRVGRPRRRR